MQGKLYLIKPYDMKNFSMQFTHPITGIIRLFKANENTACHIIKVKTNENHLLNLSLAEMERGTWNIVLTWEYENQHFVYNRSISIS